jgi:short-subunit dehydrogenase
MIRSGMTALVTGASSGIGEHLARQLAARGLNLILLARSADRLDALAAELRTAHPGITAHTIAADLSLAEAPQSVLRELEQRGLSVDLLINNAGFGTHDPLEHEDPHVLAREIQVNCSTLVGLTARLLPGMLGRRLGGVLNVASTAAFQPTPTMAVYGATKAFVLSFTEALWVETRGTGVRVLALCPGPTSTRFFETAGAGKQFLTRGRQSPEQVASVALRAFDTGRGPTVISGNGNRLLAGGYRFMPRALMARMAARNVQSH